MRYLRAFSIGWCIGTVLMLLINYAFSAELAIGDSIAVGLNLPGDAKVGRSPKAVVAAIAQINIKRLYGAVVILSTGLSNDPTQMDYVTLQLDMLKAAGAKVIVLGVGEGVPGLSELNPWLQSQAEARDMIFLWGWSGVHPASYRWVLDGARQAECKYWRLCEV